MGKVEKKLGQLVRQMVQVEALSNEEIGSVLVSEVPSAEYMKGYAAGLEIGAMQAQIFERLTDLQNNIDAIGEFVAALGSINDNRPVRLYLKGKSDKLIGRAHRLNEAINLFMPGLNESMYKVALTTFVTELTACIDLIDSGKVGDPLSALSAIYDIEGGRFERLCNTFRQEVNTGGADDEPSVTLLADYAQEIRAKGYEWGDVVIKAHQRLLIDCKTKNEPRYSQALEQLQTHGDITNRYSNANKTAAKYLSNLYHRKKNSMHYNPL